MGSREPHDAGGQPGGVAGDNRRRCDAAREQGDDRRVRTEGREAGEARSLHHRYWRRYKVMVRTCRLGGRLT